MSTSASARILPRGRRVRARRRLRWTPLAAAARALRGSRRARLALVCALVGATILGGGWLWFRDSSFVAVRTVLVGGLSGPDAGAIEAALTREARRMSTLDFDSGALRAAVAAYPQIAAISATTSFPHTVHVQVLEQLPVAVLQAPDGARTAVSARGIVLGSRLTSGALPAIAVPALAARRVSDGQVLAYLQVLGAAPPALDALVERVSDGARGITVTMRGGITVYFGDTSRPHAKWLAFARVALAQGSSATGYVDVRVPERPAVGAAGSGPAAASAASATAPSGEAALVSALQAAVGGEAAAQAPATAGVEAERSAAEGAEEERSEEPAGEH